jgi:hypothetical protein
MRFGIGSCEFVRAAGAAGPYWTVALIARMISGFIQ